MSNKMNILLLLKNSHIHTYICIDNESLLLFRKNRIVKYDNINQINILNQCFSISNIKINYSNNNNHSNNYLTFINKYLFATILMDISIIIFWIYAMCIVMMLIYDMYVRYQSNDKNTEKK